MKKEQSNSKIKVTQKQRKYGVIKDIRLTLGSTKKSIKKMNDRILSQSTLRVKLKSSGKIFLKKLTSNSKTLIKNLEKVDYL